MIASFVFDLDSTVLQGELLPAIGEQLSLIHISEPTRP